MTSTIVRTDTAVFSLSATGPTVAVEKFSAVTGRPLTKDETTFNAEAAAGRAIKRELDALLAKGAVVVHTVLPRVSPEAPKATPKVEKSPAKVTSKSKARKSTKVDAHVITLGSGRLARQFVIVGKPQGANNTGTVSHNGETYFIGTRPSGDQVAWKA